MEQGRYGFAGRADNGMRKPEGCLYAFQGYRTQAGIPFGVVLQKVCEKDLNRVETFLDLLLNDFDRIENHSAFRIYAKIISMLLSRRAMGTLSDRLIAILSEEKNVERIIEGCFNYIIKEKRIISVISHCCDILSYYAKDKDWIREQLLIESDKMLVNGSAASVVCSRRLKERLKS